jgi:hypothetical protein
MNGLIAVNAHFLLIGLKTSSFAVKTNAFNYYNINTASAAEINI